MSLDTLGANDVSEEIQSYKDKIGSMDARIAAQQTQLMRKAAEFDEMKASFDDALRKLGEETQRALRLETNLSKCSEDLRNEKLVSENNQNALKVAQEEAKKKGLEARELESVLESLSHTSDEHSSRAALVAKEKTRLEARVKELEETLRQMRAVPVTPGRQRGRSSSLSNIKVTHLEAQLSEAHALVAQKVAETEKANKKLEAAQKNLVRANNETLAAETKSKKRIQDLETTLAEKDEELEYLRSGDVGQGREEELLKRIDEDEAKIEALERLVGDSHELPKLRERLAAAERQLRGELSRMKESEHRNMELTQEREEALKRLEGAQSRIEELENALRRQETEAMELQRQPHHPDENAIEGTERLLAAVERLRAERDALQRDLEFLEMESRFKIESLESQITTLSSSTTSSAQATRGDDTNQLRVKEGQLSRLGKAIMAFSVVVQHLDHSLTAAEHALPSRSNDSVVASLEARLKATEAHASGLESSLEDATMERDDAVAQLESETADWRSKLADTEAAHENTKAELAELDEELNEMISNRDSLSLQVENLANDLKAAQREMEEGEKRYSSLQFHQLNSMSSTEATSALRRQIGELEGRISRRNEQIGIHQHDIKRLETNLKLQEERLSEMTGEMELLISQKEAMVEDCADAREARDSAIAQIEKLEEDIERLEEELEDKESSIQSLVVVTFENEKRWRYKMRLAEGRKALVEARVQTVEEEHNLALKRVADLERSAKEVEGRLAASLSDTELHLKAVADVRQDYEEQLFESRASDEKKASGLVQLQTQLSSLQATLAEKESAHHAAVEDLQRAIVEKDALLAENDLEGELLQLRMKHIEEIGQLQSRLVETTSALEEAQARHDAAKIEYEEKLSESVQARETLEKKLSDMTKELEQSHEVEGELAEAREEQEEKILQLEAELSDANDQIEKLGQSETAAAASFRSSVDELTKQRDDLALEISTLKNDLEGVRGRLEEECRKSTRVTEEVSKVEIRLQEEVDNRTRLEAAHRQRVKSLNEQMEQMESKMQEVERKATATLSQLQEMQSELELVQDEKDKLQRDMTALEAEIQRAKSYSRYQESQHKDSENKIASLEAELEKARDDLASVEKAHNAAEIKLNMQSSHQKRVDQELCALKSKPKLEQALAELEERNNEMEELLKKKCAEIEQNDDRVIDMLKDNKKLTTKVESLTRKVQNLQAKLAAAKASAASSSDKGEKSNSPPPPANPVQSPPIAPTPVSRTHSDTSSSITVVSPTAQQPADPPSAQTGRGRTHSIASILRPKTPEKSVFSLPVFKGSSSPKRRSVEVLNPPPPPATSRKRSAPDDFETGDRIPAQVFNTESEPERTREPEPRESTTPRVRRVLSNIQSGFTPVRNRTTTAPPAPIVLPPKEPAPRAVSMAAVPPPLDSRAPKRGTGWLGKIRGASSQPGSTFTGDGPS
ncbi:hypothetical protein AAF712_004285 [Marasmius tenuissimus]|uniref:Uncharacterized protein n=1 Tax=Marasmius tenuissimus TaxID=585030 RepID=A0ABR3A4Z4_9AGAR